MGTRNPAVKYSGNCLRIFFYEGKRANFLKVSSIRLVIKIKNHFDGDFHYKAYGPCQLIHRPSVLKERSRDGVLVFATTKRSIRLHFTFPLMELS
jgi:hypothetical protein